MKNLTTAKTVLSVSADLVAKVAAFAAHQDVRYYLNGVCIEPVKGGGAVIVATNGHVLLGAFDPDGFAEKQIILPITLKRNRQALKKGGKISMTEDGTIFTTKELELAFICPEGEIEGKFPDWRAVIGRPEDYAPGANAVIDFHYLHLVAKTARMTPTRFYSRINNPTQSVQLFSIGDNVFGVVMPIRDEPKPAASMVPACAWAKKAEG